MPNLPWLILTTVYGACVGSFLNVVIYRLPAGLSLIRPGSHCPQCNHALAWYDNLPVVGWLLLRGKCRYCRAPISAQYPIIEAICAVLFGGLFCAYYLSPWRAGPGDFGTLGLGETWPAFLVHLVLAGALLAATMIDARLYIIPLQIPWFATAAALAVLPVASHLMPGVALVSPHEAHTQVIGAALGGVVGLAIAVALLHFRLLPLSFQDDPSAHDQAAVPPPAPAPGPAPGSKKKDRAAEAAPAPPEESPDDWLAHPHPRREVLKECLFVALPVLGMVVGWMLAPAPAPGLVSPMIVTSAPPAWLQALAGVMLGYLVAGGLVWAIRIGGTIVFGKEAMGLGDVHLLAAVGAVLGWRDSILIFFLAPFLGLLGALVMFGMSRLAKGRVRVIPYGPYLAGATVVLMLCRGPIWRLVFLLFL